MNVTVLRCCLNDDIDGDDGGLCCVHAVITGSPQRMRGLCQWTELLRIGETTSLTCLIDKGPSFLLLTFLFIVLVLSYMSNVSQSLAGWYHVCRSVSCWTKLTDKRH